MLKSILRFGAASPVLGRIAGQDGAGQDGDEGGAFHQRIAGRQLGLGEVIGQDAVLDRPEQ
jgi:hypothetical protein